MQRLQFPQQRRAKSGPPRARRQYPQHGQLIGVVCRDGERGDHSGAAQQREHHGFALTWGDRQSSAAEQRGTEASKQTGDCKSLRPVIE